MSVHTLYCRGGLILKQEILLNRRYGEGAITSIDPIKLYPFFHLQMTQLVFVDVYSTY